MQPQLPNKPKAVDLFRKEVYEHRAARDIGGELLSVPRALIWLAGVSVAAVFCVLSIAIFSQFKQTAIGNGWLDYYPESAALSLNESGNVVKVLRAEGSEVSVGDDLIEFSKDKQSIGSKPLGADLVRNLNDEIQEIDHQVSMSDTTRDLASLRATEESEALKQEISNLENSHTMIGQRVAIANTRLQRLETLGELGHAAKDIVDQRQDDLLNLQVQLRQTEIDIAQKRTALLQKRSEAAERRLLDEKAHSELAEKKSSLLGQLARIEADRGGIFSAPISGTLRELHVVPGDSLQQTATFGRIVPRDAKLIANVLLPASRIGLVEKDRPVRLAYESFPAQQYGYYTGKVIEIYPAVMSREMQTARYPMSLDGPAFLVRVLVDSETVHNGKLTLSLRSGLTFKASFDLGKKYIYEWLLGPLYEWKHR